MARVKRFALGACLGLWLAATASCGLLEPPKPASPVEAAALVAATVSGTAEAAEAALAAGRIDEALASRVYDRLVEALVYAKLAETALGQGRPGEADTYAKLAQDVLLAAEAILKEASRDGE